MKKRSGTQESQVGGAEIKKLNTPCTKENIQNPREIWHSNTRCI